MASFKVDENLPVEAADLLCRAGHDATTVGQQNLAGSSDTYLLQVCQQERRALLTLDVGFADIRTYPPGQYAGLIGCA
jgi:predicted nuclease of predicted toxin-antitoxin system